MESRKAPCAGLEDGLITFGRGTVSAVPLLRAGVHTLPMPNGASSPLSLWREGDDRRGGTVRPWSYSRGMNELQAEGPVSETPMQATSLVDAQQSEEREDDPGGEAQVQA